jgi:hypothetical protein
MKPTSHAMRHTWLRSIRHGGRLCGGEQVRSDRLAAGGPQVVAILSSGISRLTAPIRLSSGKALAGKPHVTHHSMWQAR